MDSLQTKREYDLVELNGSFYVPTLSERANRVTLSHDRVSPRRAAEQITIDPGNSPKVRRAIKDGSISLFGERIPEVERKRLVEFNGGVYYVDAVAYDNTTDYGLIFLRLAMAVLAVLLFAFSTDRLSP